MPTIVFASPKGGAGKSTSAVVLATELAQRGAAVTVIDADPNHPVSQWARRPGCPQTLTVIGAISEETIIDTIETASAKTAFVVVDLEGTASMTVAYAISRADLVIIPVQGSQARCRRSGESRSAYPSTGKGVRTRDPICRSVHANEHGDKAADVPTHP